MSLRMWVGVSWARVDSSMARKGPISLPLIVRQPNCCIPMVSGLPRTDDAKDARCHQNPVIPTDCEDDTARSHQSCPQDEYPSSS